MGGERSATADLVVRRAQTRVSKDDEELTPKTLMRRGKSVQQLFVPKFASPDTNAESPPVPKTKNLLFSSAPKNEETKSNPIINLTIK